jgi:hypothetical protein
MATACVDLLNENITESQQMYLKYCPVTYWDKGIKVEAVSFPFRFQLDMSQIEKHISDPEAIRARVLNEYLKSLSWDLSEVDLNGLGEFADKKPTKLQDVFIDLYVELATRFQPKWLKDEIEELNKIRRIEKLKGQLLPRTIVQQLLEGPVPVTSIVDSGRFNRMVLLGDPGSGKSTIAQYLCIKSACKFFPEKDRSDSENMLRFVPFRVLIRELVAERRRSGQKYSITDYLLDEINFRIRTKCPEEFLESLLATGRALVIFDGLDEVLALHEREKIRKEITHFIGLYPEATYIITSRIVGYEQNSLDPEKFIHLVILPLNAKQIRSFIERWYKARERDPRDCKIKIESLKRAIEEPDIGQLAQNPLLLTIMSLVHKAEADLPRQKVLLYDRCVQAFLANRDKAKDLLSYDENEIRACHEYLGYQLQHQAVYAEVDINELRNMLFNFFKERYPLSLEIQKKKVDEFIETAKKRVGIIVERGPGIFAFGHRSFQEYFAACYMTSNNYGIEELWNSISDKIFNPSWHETIKILGQRLGYISSRGLDQFIQKLLTINPEEYGGRPYENFILAGEIAAEKTPMSGITLIKICDKIFETALKSPDFLTRANILITMLSDGAARNYIVKRAQEILKKGTAVESRLRRSLEIIVRQESLF